MGYSASFGKGSLSWPEPEKKKTLWEGLDDVMGVIDQFREQRRLDEARALTEKKLESEAMQRMSLTNYYDALAEQARTKKAAMDPELALAVQGIQAAEGGGYEKIVAPAVPVDPNDPKVRKAGFDARRAEADLKITLAELAALGQGPTREDRVAGLEKEVALINRVFDMYKESPETMGSALKNYNDLKRMLEENVSTLAGRRVGFGEFPSDMRSDAMVLAYYRPDIDWSNANVKELPVFRELLAKLRFPALESVPEEGQPYPRTPPTETELKGWGLSDKNRQNALKDWDDWGWINRLGPKTPTIPGEQRPYGDMLRDELLDRVLQQYREMGMVGP